MGVVHPPLPCHIPPCSSSVILGSHRGAARSFICEHVKNRIKNITVSAAGLLTLSPSFPLKTILGPLSPKCSLLAKLKTVLQRMLPEDSYLLASGRLHISLTRVVDGQNVMASEFSSKEELIQRYVDGGFTGLQPVSSLEEPVITVSPFTGELDICPRDCPAIFFCFQIFNGSIQISIENLCRISYALFPPSTMVSPPGLLPA
uniref:Uncharacterized protein n=1 Tax=Malurus cyaneus samueli TaxID=2593467 RepID=A0A8C5U7J6_9PASS